MIDISKIDTNLKTGKLEGRQLDFYDVRQAPVDIYGLVDPQGPAPFRRMPLEVAETVSRSVFNLSHQTAGGRIRFMTDSHTIALRVVQREKVRYFAHMAFLGTSGFDLYEVEDGKQVYAGSLLPPVDRDTAYETMLELRGEGLREYVLNFPLYDWVSQLYLGLDSGARLQRGRPYRGADRPVVFYGSSVTQGAAAGRPGNSYCALLSRWLDIDHICLGFSGSCKGEPEMARYLASLDPAAYVIAYDYNAPDGAHLQSTHEPLFRTIRAAHPDTPILLTASFGEPSKNPDEDSAEERRRRREIVKATYDHARAAGDRRVWYLDPSHAWDAYGGNDCTADGCHPNDLGFFAIAKAMEPLLRQMLEVEA